MQKEEISCDNIIQSHNKNQNLWLHYKRKHRRTKSRYTTNSIYIEY